MPPRSGDAGTGLESRREPRPRRVPPQCRIQTSTRMNGASCKRTCKERRSVSKGSHFSVFCVFWKSYFHLSARFCSVNLRSLREPGEPARVSPRCWCPARSPVRRQSRGHQPHHELRPRGTGHGPSGTAAPRSTGDRSTPTALFASEQYSHY